MRLIPGPTAETALPKCSFRLKAPSLRGIDMDLNVVWTPLASGGIMQGPPRASARRMDPKQLPALCPEG